MKLKVNDERADLIRAAVDPAYAQLRPPESYQRWISDLLDDRATLIREMDWVLKRSARFLGEKVMEDAKKLHDELEESIRKAVEK